METPVWRFGPTWQHTRTTSLKDNIHKKQKQTKNKTKNTDNTTAKERRSTEHRLKSMLVASTQHALAYELTRVDYLFIHLFYKKYPLHTQINQRSILTAVTEQKRFLFIK